MEVGKIVYYTRENNKSRTLSLRELCLREDVDLEAVFYAVRDAIDERDLLYRLQRVCSDKVELEVTTDYFIRFTIFDTMRNQINYLKFNKKRGLR